MLAWTYNRSRELSNYYQKENPDVILLNSTGVYGTDRVKIYGYNVHERNKYQEPHSGIAIAVRKGISHQLLDDFDEDVLAIKLNTSRGDIIIATTYLPFRRDVFPRPDLMKIIRKPMPVYIFADFNARHATFGHNNSNDFGVMLDGMVSRRLLRFLGPDFPTFFNRNTASKPDLLLSNSYAHLNYALQRGDLTSSDHWPVKLTLSTKPITINTPPTFDIRNADWIGFKDSLRQEVGGFDVDADVRKDKAYIDNKLTRWFDVIHQAKERSVPTKQRRTLPHPLESDELKLIQWQFDNITRRAEVLGWTPQLLSLSKNLQGRITQECIRLFDANWKSLIDGIEVDRKDPAKFWFKVKRLLGGGGEQAAYIMNGNVKLYSDESKEEVFREKWSVIFSITPEENRNFNVANDRRVNEYIDTHREEIIPYELVDLSRLNPDSPLTRPVTVQQVKNIVRSFKNKAPGISTVNKVVLQQLPTEMLEIYTEVTNEYLSMGYFPDLYKLGLIRFTGKPGKNHTLVENYRPISLLEVPGKIFERILHTRLLKHLQDNNLINNNQYGFTKGKGTQTALAKLYEIIAISQKRRHLCNVVSRDISKAFDKVWHNGLKYKMLHGNFPDIMLRVFCSFIDNRRAKIKIGNFIGPEFLLQSGVPQGAILSPTLFNFYTFDMPAPSPYCYQIIFADDHTQVIIHPGYRGRIILANRTSREVQRMSDYESEWKIASNPGKFQLLSISKTAPAPVTVDGRIVPFRHTIKILGLELNVRGFTSHFQTRVGLAKSHLNKLKRFRNCSPPTKLYLYKALVLSRMEYPTIILAILCKTKMNKLQAVQNTALRRVFGQIPPYYTTCEDLHKLVNLETINCRLHRLGCRTWERLAITDPDLVDQSNELNQGGRYPDHRWWRRLSPLMEGEPPDPKYRC